MAKQEEIVVRREEPVTMHCRYENLYYDFGREEVRFIDPPPFGECPAVLIKRREVSTQDFIFWEALQGGWRLDADGRLVGPARELPREELAVRTKYLNGSSYKEAIRKFAAQARVNPNPEPVAQTQDSVAIEPPRVGGARPKGGPKEVEKIVLKSDQNTLVIDYKLWRDALTLARWCGWKPAATLAPKPYPFVETWDGAYEWACGQRVLDGRSLARNLHSALKLRSFIDGPGRANLLRVTTFCYREGEFSILPEKAEVAPPEKAEVAPMTATRTPEPTGTRMLVPWGGAGDTLVLGCRPVVYEVYALIKFWFKQVRKSEFALYSDPDAELSPEAEGNLQWAYERLDEVSRMMPPEVVENARAEVESEFVADNPYYWRAFVRDLPLRRNSDDCTLLPESQQPQLWTRPDELESAKAAESLSAGVVCEEVMREL